MKKIMLSLFMLADVVAMAAVGIKSPSGELSLEVDVDASGIPVYSLDYKGKTLVKPTRLGLMAVNYKHLRD
ncbi:MAG: glycoside hydrolase family 97 N-terminal domain-containing protein, partial [Muribaculaceae bacterium]|nr:glycoside hydrolase family 97 N-terminal domain-containing protein [Muribaculaceae bacterium]